ncbi:MAG TPA: biofilm PGA synthesis protein PgaB [Bacteroidales bacterium]|nr:biofilm PGA synthesis protein PgaB [Bacteroidales bacterium]HQH18650.1 biofilm PGA synthesis protein PgaB [Bacteroidales bacterium]HQI45647.1 biofilm PGA synthesis protein PgaB [Bacteroidales bacterium]
MKKLLFSLLVFGSFMYSCSEKTNKSNLIRVGVFDGHGGAQTCIWETIEAVKIDTGMLVTAITSADIASGCLDTLDAIIIPGGGGSRQFLNLGYENHLKIKEFVKAGHGIVGICAGAYLLTNTPEYACLQMNGAQGIDIEHDNRGHGLAKFTLNEAGKKIFPELANRDTCFVYYYEGPVLVDAPDSITYKTFAVMQSDVHEEGDAPSNMTNNKPFFIGNTYGKGKVFSSIAHPEATPGMRWLIPRMVRWTLNKETITYPENCVRPDLFNKEILFTKEMLKKEASLYSVLLYGKEAEKKEALNYLQSTISWDAKRWVQGLLYDSSANIRVLAAEYISNSEFTHYFPDIQAAYNNEKDKEAKEKIEKALSFLKME